MALASALEEAFTDERAKAGKMGDEEPGRVTISRKGGRSINLQGMLNNYEAVLSVLESGDENPADKTEDDSVTLHSSSIKNTRRPSLRLSSSRLRRTPLLIGTDMSHRRKFTAQTPFPSWLTADWREGRLAVVILRSPFLELEFCINLQIIVAFMRPPEHLQM